MGGFKQCYYITCETDNVKEQVYLTFGNRNYARSIFCALYNYYEKELGFQALFTPDEGLLFLTRQKDGKDENIVFRFHQRHLMWQGELPDNLKFLESYIPKEVHKINGKVCN